MRPPFDTTLLSYYINDSVIFDDWNGITADGYLREIWITWRIE